MNQPQQNMFENHSAIEEEARLDILTDLAILDTPAEAEFDTLVRLARQISGCKIALISLIDRDRQWFKAKCGIDVAETPREDAFCAHAIYEEAMMVVPDARDDPRFRGNPLVTGSPGIIFYAGVPLFVCAGANSRSCPSAIGTLCIIHDEPHDLTPDQRTALQDLAQLAEALIERRALTIKAVTFADERQSHLRQMDLRNRQFRQAERMANIGSWRLTLADNKTQWSEQVYAIHGLPVGQDPSLDNALDFYPGEARAIISTALSKAIETGLPFEVETDFATAQGEQRRVRSMGEVESQDGHPIAVIGVFQDVTQQYALEARLRRSANSDDLTGLPNRAHFNKFLSCQLDKSAKTGDPLAVLMMDLDGFKSINDKCGHRAGDALLQEFARRLTVSPLQESFFARLGGDEFVAVISDAKDYLNLEPLLTQLLVDLRMTVNHPNGPMQVSATIGASRRTADTVNSSDLLHRADIALYDAKRSGGGFAKIDGVPGFLSSSVQ